MESKTDVYLRALRAIYNGTHSSTGGSFSMSKLLNNYKVPTTLSTVLQEEKLIRKTGTTRDVRYFWTAPVQPNIKMAEIAMTRVEAKMGNKLAKKEPVKVEMPLVKSEDIVEGPKPVTLRPMDTKKEEQPIDKGCKPLEFRVSFLYGLFKFEKIIN